MSGLQAALITPAVNKITHVMEDSPSCPSILMDWTRHGSLVCMMAESKAERKVI